MVPGLTRQTQTNSYVSDIRSWCRLWGKIAKEGKLRFPSFTASVIVEFQSAEQVNTSIKTLR